jgi:hypothetical protein
MVRLSEENEIKCLKRASSSESPPKSRPVLLDMVFTSFDDGFRQKTGVEVLNEITVQNGNNDERQESALITQSGSVLLRSIFLIWQYHFDCNQVMHSDTYLTIP